MLVNYKYKHNVTAMNKHTTKQSRPTCISAGEAILSVEAWQSGLLHRAYPSADVRASNPLITSREFEPHRFHHQFSGADAAATAPAPIKHPGMSPKRMTIWTIYARQGAISSFAWSHPFNPKDELREQPFPRKTD